MPGPNKTFGDVSHDSTQTEVLNNVYQVNPGDSIQTEIDNAEADGGGTVFIAPGTHSEANITIENSDITLMGAGSASVIQHPGGNTNTVITIGGASSADRVEIKNLYLDCTAQNQPSGSLGNNNTKNGMGILADAPAGISTNDVLIENVVFDQTKNEGFGLFHDTISSSSAPGSEHPRVTNCLFLDCRGYAAIHPHNDNTGTWENNTFRNLSSILHAVRHGNTIDCVFENCSVGTGFPDAVIVGSDTGGKIEGNTIQFCSGSRGIIDFQNEEQITDNLLRNNSFTETEIYLGRSSASSMARDNRLFDASNKAILVTNDDCEVSDNFVQNASSGSNTVAAIDVKFQVGSKVVNNRVRGSNHDYGIVADGEQTRVLNNAVDSGVSGKYNFENQWTLGRNNNRDDPTKVRTGGQIMWHEPITLLDGGSSSVDATLPTPSKHPGWPIVIKAIDVTNTVKYSQKGSETIDGSAEQTFQAVNDVHRVVSDGTNWHIVGGFDASAV